MNDNFYGCAGRLVQDVVYQKNVQDGQARATGHIIINREGNKDEYDIIPFVAWDDRADIMYKNTHKGKTVLLRGPIKTNSVRDPTTEKWTNYFELLVTHITLGSDSSKSSPLSPDKKPTSISSQAAEVLIRKLKNK